MFLRLIPGLIFQRSACHGISNFLANLTLYWVTALGAHVPFPGVQGLLRRQGAPVPGERCSRAAVLSCCPHRPEGPSLGFLGVFPALNPDWCVDVSNRLIS